MFRRATLHCPWCDSEPQQLNNQIWSYFSLLSCEGGPPIALILTCSVDPLHTRAVNTGGAWHYLKEISAPNRTRAFRPAAPLRSKDKHAQFIQVQIELQMSPPKHICGSRFLDPWLMIWISQSWVYSSSNYRDLWCRRGELCVTLKWLMLRPNNVTWLHWVRI